MIIDVKKIVEENVEKLKDRVNYLKEHNIFPKLAVIVASNDVSSKSYIKNKRKMCERVGIIQKEYILDENVTTEEILNLIEKLNRDIGVHGILVQLPLYPHLDQDVILNSISVDKDVDGFNVVNVGNLVLNKETIIPCTPKGIITILDSIGIDYTGKSKIVGKPMAELLLNKNCTVSVCHSKTKNLKFYTTNADILIVAVGRPNFITKDMVKQGAVVIDVGINNVDGKLVGDVLTSDVSQVASYITKVPGGVGLTTVLSLIENIIILCEKK